MICSAARPAFAQDQQSTQSTAKQTPAKASEKSAKSSKEKSAANELPPLPANKSIDSTVLDGRTLRYTVTVGTIDVRDASGKIAGNVVYTSYTVPGKDRPVTFAFNGGPGASSVFLNFGAIGPKHLDGIGNKGDSASGQIVMSDNQGTWLDFTDLVFIDPIGTGYSRSLASPAKQRNSSTARFPTFTTCRQLSTSGSSRMGA